MLTAASVGQGEIALITAALKSMKGLSDQDNRLVLFDRKSYSQTVGCFQMNSFTVGPLGLSVALSCFNCNATSLTTRFLWTTFTSTTLTLDKYATVVTLNLDQWDRQKDRVISLMNEWAQAYIARLPDLDDDV